MKKIAFILPGIGYKLDRSLLYFGKKIAEKKGYETVCVTYSPLPKDISQAIEIGYKDLVSIIKNSGVNLAEYEHIAFISKSIGTAVSARFVKEQGIKALQVLYTPIPYTFEGVVKNAVAFSGTSDPFYKDNLDSLVKDCSQNEVKLFLFEGANHSLETSDPVKDIETLQKIMQETELFLP